MQNYFARLQQKGRNVDSDERRCARRIIPGLGGEPVDLLTTAMLDAWLAGLVRGKTDEKIRASRASAMALGESGRAAFCDLLAVDLTAWRHAGRAATGEEDLERLTGAVISVLEQWTRL
jgi:hypothetical protein